MALTLATEATASEAAVWRRSWILRESSPHAFRAGPQTRLWNYI